MSFVRGDSFLAEGKREGCALVPRLPLIHVIRAEEISALSSNRIQSGLIEIRQIRREALRRPVIRRDGLYRVSATRLFPQPGYGPMRNHWNLTQDRMLDIERVKRSPSPRGEIFRRLWIVDDCLNRRRQQFIVIRILLRQPSLRPMEQDVLQPDRPL